ncbi:MAG: membrane protein insertase YidC, partial [Methylococcales bacterium]
IILYQLSIYWEIDYAQKPAPVSRHASEPQSIEPSADLPKLSTTTTPTKSPDEAKISYPASNDRTTESIEKKKITVTSDRFRLQIDSSGTIVLLELLAYPVKMEAPNIPLKLFGKNDNLWFLAQSGLTGPSDFVSNHKSLYSFERDSYELSNGQDILRVPMYWTNGKGIEIEKTFVVERGNYLIQMEQTILNHSDLPWTGGQYVQLQRSEQSEEEDSTFIRTYTGGVIYDEKYEKLSFDHMRDQNLDREVTGGWIAMIQHYFAAAWIPQTNEKNRFYTIALPDQNRFVIGYSSAQSIQISPGDHHTFNSRLYAGPKIQSIMERTVKGLELTVDYGILTVIGKPIFWMLNKFHGFVQNWGFAIAMVTMVIKGIFFPLSAASYRSMAKMRKLQPKLQAIKERYEDDKPRFNQEMMALYRTEKVNPLGGCFPILVQIPVFISLYWVLMETVELRQAPFLLWINDLSVKDPYYVLPLLMGLTMWIQQRLNPTPVDPMQEKVMKLFPYIFTVFFLWFPAGLVLYWVVNNSLSILQQWYITKRIEQTP